MMIKQALFFIFSILPMITLANDQKIKEIDSLLQLSKDYRYQVETEPAIETAYMALTKSVDINYSKGKASAYLYLAQTIIHLGEYEESLKYLSLAEREPYTSKNLSYLFEISRIRGQIFSYMGFEEQSIGEFQKCISLTKKFNDQQLSSQGLSMSYENLTVVYNKIGKPDSAFFFINKNKELLESMDESNAFRGLVNLYTTLGEWYINEGDYESAANQLYKAFFYGEKYKYPYLSRTLMYMGDIHEKKQNQDSTLYYYHQALSNLQITKIKGELASVYNRLYTLHEIAGEIDSAKIYREKQNSIESELSEAREKSISEALTVLLNEQKKIQKRQSRKILTYISISTFILFILNIIGWMKTKKKLVSKKDQLKTELVKTIKVFEEIEKESVKLEKKVNESFKEVINLAKDNDPTFLKRFQEVYAEHSSILLQKHPNLTKSELILCAFLYLNFSTKDIANYTCVEHRSVQTKKSRLRKKLNLPANSNIEIYLHSFTVNEV